MSLIDWSDPEEMLGLLRDYVADEATASHKDSDRSAFLQGLSEQLEAIIVRELATGETIAQALVEIRSEVPEEFARDPVIDHLDACIEELRRIAREA